jgi:hypothetical protein
VVERNSVGDGVMRESVVKHSVDGAGDGDSEGLSGWWEWC